MKRKTMEDFMEGVKTEVESWQISGNSPAAYEKYLVPGIFKPWAETLEPYRGDRGIVFPMETRMIVAEKKE